jgi:PAS domain S-box-containing protein
MSLIAIVLSLVAAGLGYAAGRSRPGAETPPVPAGTGSPVPDPAEAGEARWRRVIDTDPECLGLVSADGRVQHLNAAGRALFDVDESRDLTATAFEDLVLPAHREDFRDLVAGVFRGEHVTAAAFETRGVRGTRRWITLRAAPLRDSDGRVVSMLGVAHDVTSQKRAEDLLRWEKQALELIMRPGSLEEVLERLMTGLEAQAPGALCSVLLVDETGRRLRRGAAPSLPAIYSQAIDGIGIGPRVGSCGTAASLDRQVIVADIATDPLWQDYRSLALSHDLRACWSTPIHAESGTVLGTFAVYYHQPRHPSADELELIERAERIVALAIMRKQGDTALREHRERLDLALQSGALGVWEWFPQTGQTTHSSMWARMLEYDLSEVGTDIEFFARHVHPDDLPEVRRRLEDHLEGRTPAYESQHRMRTKSGAWKWVIDRGRVVRADENGPVLVSGVISDITALKTAEAALQASQERYELAVLGSSDGLWDWDMRTNEAYFSPRWKAMLGFQDHEIASDYDTWRSLLHPDDVAPTIAALQAYLEGRAATYHPEFRMRCKDGTYKWILARGAVLRDGDGRPVRMAGSHSDITMRRAAEEGLRASRQMVEAILDAIPVRVFWKDRDLRYLGCNAAFARDAGFDDPKDLLGKDDYQMAWREQADLYRADDRAVIESGLARLHIEEPQSTPEGGTIWLLTSKLPLRDADGHVTAVLGTYLDISERKRAEEEVRRLNADLEDTVRARTEALRQSETKYRLMIESSRDAILTLHPPDWHFTSCNAAAVELLGAESEAQVCATLPWQLSPDTQPDGTPSVQKAQDHILRAMESGAESFEWTHAKVDGTPFAATVLLSRVEQEDGGYLLATVRDITAQKQAEAAMKALNENLDQLVTERSGQLRESEERFRVLVDAAPNAVVMAGPDGRITFANRRTLDVFGYQPEELVGRLVETLIPESRRAEHVRLRSANWSTLPPRSLGRDGSLSARRKDGSDVAVEVGLTPVEVAGQTFMMATITDITARRRAEEAVTRLAAFPEVNPNPVLELASDGSLAYHNGAATALARDLGLPDAVAMVPADVAAIVRQCLAAGEARRGLEYRFGKRVLSWAFYPIAGRGVVHAYAADVTERLALEAQLRQSQKMEAIGQLAGGVAHDFNNILSVVLMQAEVSAAADDLPEDTVEGLREIQACAERGADLTRQLLLFSRRQVMQTRDLDLNDVVTALAKMLQRIIGEDVRLELHLHTSKLPARADAGMLNQVLLNLAVNARDAMPRGGRLRVETWDRLVDETTERPYPDIQPGHYVGLSVVDTGCGIPADVLPRIFEPFFTTKEAGKGTGLGLATVFGIVRQHGGWLNVSSEVGQGTTFDIYLPLAAQTGAEPAPRRRTIAGGSETLLVVEDEASVRTLVRSILERRGYTVLEAANGVDALKLWEAHRDRIALLFTDMVMPDGISGQDLARRLRTERPDLRVVFSSGYSPEIAGRELRLAAGENFLPKPFTSDVLLEVVRQAIDARPTAA